MPALQQLLDRARQVGAGAAVDVPSPCISVCRMDPRTQLCEGCCRTLEEIAAWSKMDDEQKRAVWQAIAERALKEEAVIPAKAGIQPAENMKQITFYLDFVSPYAYLAFEKLPEALLGLSYGVDYKPVLFAGLLKHHGQLGPAEIGPKRDWTYRQVLWLAHTAGVPMQMPAAHPFNPLPLLRLALACEGARKGGQPVAQASTGLANRYVCETIFRHVWRGGADALDAQRLQALQQSLAPQRDPAGEDVKAQLKANTDEAIGRGLFGVPTYAVDDKLFWGFDALPMLRAYLEGDAWFASGAWESPRQLPVGASRIAKA